MKTYKVEFIRLVRFTQQRYIEAEDLIHADQIVSKMQNNTDELQNSEWDEEAVEASWYNINPCTSQKSLTEVQIKNKCTSSLQHSIIRI